MPATVRVAAGWVARNWANARSRSPKRFSGASRAMDANLNPGSDGAAASRGSTPLGDHRDRLPRMPLGRHRGARRVRHRDHRVEAPQPSGVQQRLGCAAGLREVVDEVVRRDPMLRRHQRSGQPDRGQGCGDVGVRQVRVDDGPGGAGGRRPAVTSKTYVDRRRGRTGRPRPEPPGDEGQRRAALRGRSRRPANPGRPPGPRRAGAGPPRPARRRG